MHPIFDTTALSDDELMSRITRITKYLQMQTSLGHNDAVDDLNTTLSALISEQQSRFQVKIVEDQLKKNVATSSTIELGKLDETPNPIFIDEDERRRVSKIKRRRI